MAIDGELKETLTALARSLGEVRVLQAQQKAAEAGAALRALIEKVEALPSGHDEVLEMQAAVLTESALLHQRLGDARSAVVAYTRAENVGRKLPVADPTSRYRLLLATTLVNAAGLYARQRAFEDSEARIVEALELIRGFKGENEAPAAVKMLLLGALQNQAVLLFETRRLAESEAPLREIFEIGTTLISGGSSQLLPQTVEAAGRLVVVLRQSQRLAEAVPIAEQAAKWAEAALESGSQLGVPLFAGTRLTLAEVYHAVGRYAQAEDQLWKAIDAVQGDGQPMLVAADFYLRLMRYEDEQLENGDLPRDEVQDGFDELKSRLKQVKAPDLLLQLLAAREAVVARNDIEAGQRGLDSLETADLTAVPVVRMLLPALRSDLEWARSKVN
jgi:tetratricopeptide (TPR) repeat protein